MSDDPIEPLPFEYDVARLELMEHNYRKMFGLSYQQLLDEPFDKVKLSLRIETMQNKQLQIQNKNHGN